MNFGKHLSKEIIIGVYDRCAVWAATDNTVWSAVYNKGLSTDKHLFAVVLELRVLCIKHQVFLDVFLSQDTGWFSRGWTESLMGIWMQGLPRV